MKTCPSCRAQYDDYMRFCLQDGAPLTGGDAEPATEAVTETYDLPRDTNPPNTEAVTEQWSEQNASEETITAGQKPFAAANQFPAPPTQVISEPPRKSGAGIFFGALLLGGLLLIGAVIGGVFWLLSNQNEIAFSNTDPENSANSNGQKENPVLEDSNANISNAANLPFANSNDNIKITPTPKPSVTPKPSETKTPEKTPTPENKPTPENEPTPKPPPNRPISGGVLNGKATSLPKPAYPQAAKAVGASGTVNVQVLVDENGNVVSASPVNGHPLLRSAAAGAARRAKFRPTQLGGQAVKVTGIIVYNFVL